MLTRVVLAVCLAGQLIGAAATPGAGAPRPPVSLAVLRVRTAMSPPAWALLERALLEANAEAARTFARKYTRPDGQLIHRPHWGGNDGPDDAMENFWNWPLLYALGGAGDILPLYRRIWETHLLDYTAQRMIHREFVTAFDWEHNSEYYAAFLHEGLADPTDARFQARARRFAEFYTGDDPAAPNYDRQHKLLRSVLTGSRGPALEVGPEWWYDRREPERADYFKNWTRVKGDIPLNLCSTSLVANAYLLTGDEKYRRWIEEYTGAWVARAKANGGDFPGNVGLNGRVGEDWDGTWYGGMMGWDWTFGGFGMITRSLRTGILNANLVSGGNPLYLDALRTQMTNLLKRGNPRPPDRYNEKQGWHAFGFGVHFPRTLAELYLNSFSAADWTRIEQTRAWLSGSEDPSGGKDFGHEYDWLAYLHGERPEHPETILRAGLEKVRRNVDRITNDRSDPATWTSDHAHGYLPVVLEGLIQLQLGAPTPSWASGLLHAQVRYFDAHTHRAGLPADVAALVDSIGPEAISVSFVNTSQTAEREVLVQAGAYGEHTFTTATLGSTVTQIDSPHFRLQLAPGCGARISLGLRRMSRKPSLAFPWHEPKE